MKINKLNACLCFGALFLFAAKVNSAVLELESRLGGLAFYDPNLDITWAANATTNGVIDTWENQNAWVEGFSLGGVSGWRLPSADVNGDGVVVNCFGGGVVGCEDNEMGYLYWEEGITPTTPGPFSNVVTSDRYWTSTESATISIAAWYFYFYDGNQIENQKWSTHYAWAVRPGDIGSVPIPATVWLFASGLVGLIGFSRCTQKRT